MDYYKILGVNRTATPDEIKQAYRKLSKKYHPDVNKEPGAEDKFKEAASAYEILSDKDKRSNYDRFGNGNQNQGNQNQGNPFGGQGHGFSPQDIFEQFGDIFGNSFNQRYQQKRQNKGSDLRMKVELSIDDILKGSTKKLKYKRQDKCDPCQGKGGSDVRDCMPCKGSGQRTVLQNTQFGQIRHQSVCPDCRGSGKIVTNKCNICKGDGTVVREQVVDAEIPAGVSNGMSLVMNGFGNHIRDGIAGDLQIIVEEIKESYFVRELNNIIVEKKISVIDAIIGSVVIVKTPHGDISIIIESGTEHGKVVRITGKGIPDVQHGLGDLYVKISIKIPKSISPEEKKILEGLKKSNSFNV